VNNLGNGYEKAIVLMAENAKTQTELSKTQTELLAKMSGNIEGMRVEVKDATEEVSKLRTGGMKILTILIFALLSVAIPVNAIELIRIAMGGGL